MRGPRQGLTRLARKDFVGWQAKLCRATLGATAKPSLTLQKPRTSPESPIAAPQKTLCRAVHALPQQIQYCHAHRDSVLHLVKNN